ncbi:MAG: diguanylate cyclase, partial [Clostridiales bacterium]|nr:diguanylate cyclase [Clostridiales bacterium]
DPEAARAAFKGQRSDYKSVVYVGPSEDVKDILDMIRDIWPASEDDEIRRFRIEQMIRNIREKYMAWLNGNMLETMIDSEPSLVWFKDVKGAHMKVNKKFSDTVHKTKEDIRGRGHYYIWDITPEEYATGEYVCMESEEEVMKVGKTCVFDEPLKTSEGMKQLKTYKTPLYDPFGAIYGTVGVAHDVTDFGKLGLELTILIENLPFPLVLCDVHHKAIKMNDAFKRLVNIPLKTNMHNWIRKNLEPVGEVEIKEKTRTRKRQFIFDDKILNVTEQEIIDYFDNTSGYFIIIEDVTVEKNFERVMIEAANTDALTGLFNRRYFYEFLKYNAKKKMTLFYMDLDRFKSVNDRYGHKKGDEVLQSCAKAITSTFEKGIAARLGGDEFAVIVEGVLDKGKIDRLIKKLEKQIGELVSVGESDLTISVGYSLNDGTRDIDSFISEGDSMMYEVKEIHHSKEG